MTIVPQARPARVPLTSQHSYPLASRPRTFRSLCGIYEIRNVWTQNVYIGMTRDIADRWDNHFQQLKSGCHTSSMLQKEFAGCGADAFTFTVLETCDLVDLSKREHHWLLLRSKETKLLNTDQRALQGNFMSEENTSPVPETHEPMLTLKQLHSAVVERGIKISYSGLSELISEGNIAQQLNAGGQGNRREFFPETVNVLSRFLVLFQKTGAKRPHAPYLMSRFLESGSSTEVALTENNDLPILSSSTVSQSAELSELTVSLRELITVIRDERIAPEDRLLTAEDAATMLACSPRSVSRYVKPVLPRKWRQSDIFEYISGLKQ